MGKISGRLKLLTVAGILALVMSVFSAGPAQASFLCCGNSAVTASYTSAGGVVYQAYAHLRIDVSELNPGDVQAQLHWHCQRAGQPWDGCRADGTLTIQRNTGTWTNFGEGTYVHSPNNPACCNPNDPTQWFQDSPEFSDVWSSLGGWQVRARISEGNVRFRLGDGSNVLIPTFPVTSTAWNA